MGVSLDGQKTGRRRSLDAELNLVPFIDLLSMCICFLLMTAIWVEINSLQTKQALGTEADAAKPDAIDIQVRLLGLDHMKVSIERGGRLVQEYQIQEPDQKATLAHLNNVVGAVVSAAGNPEQISSWVGRVVPAKDANYGYLVSVLDLLKSYGIAQLAVIPVKE